MPISETVELKAPEKKVWSLIPEDVYQAQITDISEDVSEFKGEKKEVFKFEFTIIEPGAHYGRKLWKNGSRVAPCPSSTGKAPLTWKVASAVLKHPLTEEEGKSFTVKDLNALIDQQIRINVSVTPPKDGKQYNNVEAFLMAKELLPAFDEAKVKQDAPAPVAKLTPADIVAQASQGKFTPHTAPQAQEAVEVDDISVEEIPY